MRRRRIGGIPLTHIPALMDIARDDFSFVVIQKSAQIGITELLVNLALWAADTAYAERGNVLYTMPTQNQMDDFTQSRFDRALQDSPYLRGRLQPEPPRRKGADRLRLKHLGDGYIFLRGSESRGQIASVDADLVVLDEFDQMAEGILDLALKRLASSRAGLIRVASTPRFAETGINELFLQSDQRRYHLPCRSCDLEQPLTFEQNVDRERALLVCRDCRVPMDVMTPGKWVAEAPGNDRIHGYHLSRLYSPWLDIAALIDASTATTPAALQEFHNSDLGEVYAAKDSGLSRDILDRCRGDYSLDDYRGEDCVMGVDVGRVLHVVIRECPQARPVQYVSRPQYREIPAHYIDTDTGELPPGMRAASDFDRPQIVPRAPQLGRLVFAAEVGSFDELDGLMRRFHVHRCVVDQQPDLHKAGEFAKKHRGAIDLARYGREQPGMERTRHSDVSVIHVNRTEIIDETFERFRVGSARLPRDARQLGDRVKQGIGEYFRELLALKRTLEQDSRGNWVARWIDSGKADHFAHAEAYALLAAKRASGGVLHVIP
jgi:hypothetical protein